MNAEAQKTYPVGGELVRDMTKRECMASEFTAALLAHYGANDLSYEGVANYAVEQADALLVRLAK